MAVENEMEDSTRPPTSLNNQAFETVRAVNQQVVGDQDAVLASIASQAMVQSCSLALQDAVDHLRRVQFWRKRRTRVASRIWRLERAMGRLLSRRRTGP
jgi:pyruvate formate-lyase activating enzyme-like uncharacterized protein